MEIEIFTLCDFAQDNQSKLTIVGTFDSINAKQFPTQHPACSIACRLRFSSKEAGEHTFKLRLIDSDGKEIIQSIEGNMNIDEYVFWNSDFMRFGIGKCHRCCQQQQANHH